MKLKHIIQMIHLNFKKLFSTIVVCLFILSISHNLLAQITYSDIEMHASMQGTTIYVTDNQGYILKMVEPGAEVPVWYDYCLYDVFSTSLVLDKNYVQSHDDCNGNNNKVVVSYNQGNCCYFEYAYIAEFNVVYVPPTYKQTVNTTPTDATIKLDGVVKTSPITGVIAGNHTLTVEKTGYVTSTETINVSSDVTKNVSLQQITGIVEIENLSIKIYPNPVTDYLSIETQEKISEITIFEIQGKIVYSNTKPDNKIRVSVSNFQLGLYLIKLSMNNTTINYRFVKQ